MKTLLVLSLLLIPSALGAKRRPKRNFEGEHICWAKAKKKLCGTYAVSTSKELARVGAIRHCMYACGRECYLDYCSVLK